jgi:hypothetical protein
MVVLSSSSHLAIGIPICKISVAAEAASETLLKPHTAAVTEVGKGNNLVWTSVITPRVPYVQNTHIFEEMGSKNFRETTIIYARRK